MSNTKKLKEKILTEDYKEIPFTWKTDKCGHAEFVVCPIVKRGKIREVYVYPSQQPKAEDYFVFKADWGLEGIHFGTHLKTDGKISQPIVWKTHFCKEHKSHSFNMYVPVESKAFFLTTGLGCLCFNWR